MFARFLNRNLGLLALAFFAGCGSDEYVAPTEQTVSAAGVIKYKGQPLDFYRVSVLPSDKRPASGITDAEGRFTLGTNAEGDGAVVGTHTLTVEYVGPTVVEEPGKESFEPPPAAKVNVPKKYSSAATSGLTVEIPAGGRTDLEINIE